MVTFGNNPRFSIHLFFLLPVFFNMNFFSMALCEDDSYSLIGGKIFIQGSRFFFHHNNSVYRLNGRDKKKYRREYISNTTCGSDASQFVHPKIIESNSLSNGSSSSLTVHVDTL